MWHWLHAMLSSILITARFRNIGSYKLNKVVKSLPSLIPCSSSVDEYSSVEAMSPSDRLNYLHLHHHILITVAYLPLVATGVKWKNNSLKSLISVIKIAVWQKVSSISSNMSQVFDCFWIKLMIIILICERVETHSDE